MKPNFQKIIEITQPKIKLLTFLKDPLLHFYSHFLWLKFLNELIPCISIIIIIRYKLFSYDISDQSLVLKIHWSNE